jgi:hypothetical protein
VEQVLEDGAGMNFGTFAEMPEIAGNVQVIARSMSRDNSAIQNSANVVTKLQQLLSAFQDDVKLYYERNRNKLGTSAENRSASDWMRVTRGAEGFTSLDFADQLTQGQIGEIENTVNSVTGLADVDTTPVEGIRDPQQKAAAALAKLKKFNELCKK